LSISRLTLILIVLVRGSVASAADPTAAGEAVVSDDGNHFSQRFSLGKNVIVVDIRTQAFQKANHRLTVDKLGSGVRAVDGRRVLGTDGGSPELLKSEIVGVQVSWNGTARRMARRFYSDCFNTSVTPYRIVVSDDFRAIMITMHGGEGAGAYEVTWTVSQEGAVARFLAETGNLN
jgi:hypothetical protein